MPLIQRHFSHFALAAGLCLAGAAFDANAADKSRTLGFVVTTWNTAIYESRFMDECPEGLNLGNDEFWWRGLSKADRSKLTQNGMVTQIERMGYALTRGPKGENVCQIPTAVTDPPLLIAEGPVSFGANLDGTTDGRATPKSCAHAKFEGVDGTPAVDNQMYRLLGCSYGWRNYGHIELNANGQRKTNGLGMILIEVANVDDARNDSDVDVTFYRSIDQFVLDSAANVIPYSTYRIDQANGVPRYGSKVKGKIANGVLQTTPSPEVRLPFYGNYTLLDQTIKDMSLKLEIEASGDRAKGQIVGYYDADQMADYLGGLGFAATAQYSCPAFHTALYQLADGYPDPKTGKCTALSSAWLINTVAAFVDHTESTKVAQK